MQLRNIKLIIYVYIYIMHIKSLVSLKNTSPIAMQLLSFLFISFIFNTLSITNISDLLLYRL